MSPTRQHFRAAHIMVYSAVITLLTACSDSSDSVSPTRPVASVRLTPTSFVLDLGATRQLTAVALDEAGNTLEGRAVQWATDAASVATVSESGLVRAVASGYADITATVGGKSATTAVTVATPEPERLGP